MFNQGTLVELKGAHTKAKIKGSHTKVGGGLPKKSHWEREQAVRGHLG